jgi:3-phosphoinositide dependent protein kinase-1
MFTGKTPFKCPSQNDTLDKVLAGVYDIPAFVPKEAADLIKKLLVKEPYSRLGAGSDPRDLSDSGEANEMNNLKAHPFFAEINFATLHFEKPPVSSSNIVASPEKK